MANNDRFLELCELTEFNNKLNSSLTGRIRYVGEAELSPSGAARTSWDDLISRVGGTLKKGDCFRLKKNGTEESVEIGGVTYYENEYIFSTGKFVSGDTVTVQKLTQHCDIDNETIITNSDGELTTAVGGYVDDTETVIVSKTNYARTASFYNNGKYHYITDNLTNIFPLHGRADEDWYIKFSLYDANGNAICEDIEIAYVPSTDMFGTYNSAQFAYYEYKRSYHSNLTIVYTAAYSTDVTKATFKIYSKTTHHKSDAKYINTDKVTLQLDSTGLGVRHDNSLVETGDKGLLRTAIGGATVGSWTGTISNYGSTTGIGVSESTSYKRFDFDRAADYLTTKVEDVYDIAYAGKLVYTKIYFKYVDLSEVEHEVSVTNLNANNTLAWDRARGTSTYIGTFDGIKWYILLEHHGRRFTIATTNPSTVFDDTHNTITDVSVTYSVSDFNYTIPNKVLPIDNSTILYNGTSNIKTAIGGGTSTIDKKVIWSTTLGAATGCIANYKNVCMWFYKSNVITYATVESYLKTYKTLSADCTFTFADGTTKTFTGTWTSLNNVKWRDFVGSSFHFFVHTNGNVAFYLNNASYKQDVTSIYVEIYSTANISKVDSNYLNIGAGLQTGILDSTILSVNHDATMKEVTDNYGSNYITTSIGGKYLPALRGGIVSYISGSTGFIDDTYTVFPMMYWGSQTVWDPSRAEDFYITNGKFNIVFDDAGVETTETITYTTATYDGMWGDWGYKYKLDVQDSRGGSFWWVFPNNKDLHYSMFMTDQTTIGSGTYTLTHASPWPYMVAALKYEPIDGNYIPVDGTTIKLNDDNKLSATYIVATALPATGVENQVAFIYS